MLDGIHLNSDPVELELGSIITDLFKFPCVGIKSSDNIDVLAGVPPIVSPVLLDFSLLQ